MWLEWRSRISVKSHALIPCCGDMTVDGQTSRERRTMKDKWGSRETHDGSQQKIETRLCQVDECWHNAEQ